MSGGMEDCVQAQCSTLSSSDQREESLPASSLWLNVGQNHKLLEKWKVSKPHTHSTVRGKKSNWVWRLKYDLWSVSAVCGPGSDAERCRLIDVSQGGKSEQGCQRLQ